MKNQQGSKHGLFSLDSVLKVTLFVLSGIGYLLAEVYSRTRLEIAENRGSIASLDRRTGAIAERVTALETGCVRK